MNSHVLGALRSFQVIWDSEQAIGRAGLCAAMVLVAGCGGGSSAPEAAAESRSGTALAAAADWKRAEAVTASRGEAFRVLTQATFGPSASDLSRVQSIGVTAWLDEQLARPYRAVYYPSFQAESQALRLTDPLAKPRTDFVYQTFYTQAMTAQDQLRQRVAYALSQIFVVSLASFEGQRASTVASYYDMLAKNAFGNYRDLLQDVALHPAMGLYLSHRGNQKEDARTGRLPDENFAREVMQLFSIGLVSLYANGTPKLDSQGQPIETYTPDDVSGLAKVFTGWSWGGPDTSDNRFFGLVSDPAALHLPMQAYPKFHSMSEKRFLGAVIPAQSSADPAASLKVALDTLFNHPNVGPFIGRQLIQRLVTSNPSPAYVRRVALVFDDNGSGTRGDMAAVVRAILTDGEARKAPGTANNTYGKLREPVLRMTALMRAYNATSNSGKYLILRTDDPTKQLNQSPLRSPSVFNFYRPGYAPAGSQSAANAMKAPELQLVNESSVVGAVNYFKAFIPYGQGLRPDGPSSAADVNLNLSAEFAAAPDAVALVDMVFSKLSGEFAAPDLKSQVVAAVESIDIPKLNKDASNQVWIDLAKNNRVYTAMLLVTSAHETQIQR